jgi:amidase
MLDATAGPSVGAPYYPAPPSRPFLSEIGTDPGRLRIAYSATPLLGSSVHEDCVEGLEATAQLCKDLGHDLIEAAPQIDGTAFAAAFLTMLCGEVKADIDESADVIGRTPTYGDYEYVTWDLGLLGGHISAGDVVKAIRHLQRACRQIGRFFADYDLYLTPTLSEPPVKHGALHPQGFEKFGLKLMGRLGAGGMLDRLGAIDSAAEGTYEFIPYTLPFNVTGQPAMSVPLQWKDGLPVGMHFVGRYGDEATLFRLAGQLEQAKPWFDHRPPMAV